jgi:hypothetical protein
MTITPPPDHPDLKIHLGGQTATSSTLESAVVIDEGLAGLRALFDKLDKDSGGTVDKKEWGRSLSQNKALMAKHFGGETMGAPCLATLRTPFGGGLP